MIHARKLLEAELMRLKAAHSELVEKQKTNKEAHEDDRWSWQFHRENTWREIEEIQAELNTINNWKTNEQR